MVEMCVENNSSAKLDEWFWKTSYIQESITEFSFEPHIRNTQPLISAF